MTDNEIIKALECCNGFESCPDDCPYYSKEFKKKFNCLDEKVGVMAKAVDIITRQKAEIERLKDLTTYQKQEIKEKEQKYNQAVDDIFGLVETTKNEIAEAKSKAIKEFCEKIIEKKWDADTRCGYVQVVDVGDIEDTLKELSEVSDNA